ncbi:MAG: hypothetical protein K0S25_1518 [Bacillus sp. (in: firmicutes)]|nr:hypothetical protein [Bacillus sp. (in: firmicutes)]
MGGVFLVNSFVQLILGLLCGILLVKWMPLSYPISITEMFLKFVLYPLQFFASSIAFIFGSIIHGNLIRYIFSITPSSKKRRSNLIIRLLILLGVLINFFVLCNIGFWQSGFLLCCSIVYGMISVVFQD